MNRGSEAIILVNIVLVAVALLVMGNLMLGYRQATDTMAEKELCRSSVRSVSNVRTPFGRVNYALQCPTVDLLITEKLDNERGKDYAKKQVADAMYHCWDKFDRGDATLFDDQGIYCSVCNWIEFEDKDKELVGMTDYLAKTNIGSKPITYLDFLAKKETPTFKAAFEQYKEETALEDSMNTNQLYSIIFVYARGDQSLQQLAQSYIGPVPVTGATVSGSSLGLMAAAKYGPHPLIRLGAAGVLLGSYGASIEYQLKRKPQWLASIALVPHNEGELGKLGCAQYVSTK